MARPPRLRAGALLLAALLCCVPGRSAESGTGRYDPAAGTLDIIVYFAYPETDFASWHETFQLFSRALYDATERQLRLREVTFTTSESLKDRADVWVTARDTGLASASANGINNRGRFIQIHQNHKINNATNRGYFGLLHEAGHYLFGLLDEYRGCTRPVNGVCSVQDHDVRLVDPGTPGPATAPGSDVRGRVYEDSGVVLDRFDNADTPLENVEVRLRRADPGLAATVVGTQRTAADGTYLFPQQPTGQYQLEILGLDAPGNRYASDAFLVDDVRFQTDRTKQPAVPLRITGRNVVEVRVDVPLVVGQPDATARMLGGVSRGRLYRKRQEPTQGECDRPTRDAACLYQGGDPLVPGVQVLLERIDENGARVQAGLTLTGAGGAYEFRGLALGRYELRVLGLEDSALSAAGYTLDNGLGAVYQPLAEAQAKAPVISVRMDQSDRTGPEYYCSVQDGALGGCVMDAGTTTVGRNTRTELCTDAGVDDGVKHRKTVRDADGNVVSNSQEWVYGMGCWQRVAQSEIPLAVPAAALTSDTTGWQPPTFREINGDMGVMVLVDTSLSMDPTQQGDPDSRLGMARTGAINAIDVMQENEWLGIIPFGSTVSDQPFDLTMVSGDDDDGNNAVKDAAAAYVNALGAEGWTAMGDALRAAFDALEALPDDAVANKAIILLTDGRSTLGAETPDGVLKDIVETSRVEIHAIALGPQADAEGLARLAEASRGSFNAVADPQKLPEVFQRVVAEARNEVPSLFATSTNLTGDVPAGGSVTVRVELSSFATTGSFVLSYANGAPLEVLLKAPDGSFVSNDGYGDPNAVGIRACADFDCSTGNPAHDSGNNVEFRENPAQQFYRIPGVLDYGRDPNAERQVWEVQIDNLAAGGPDEPFVLFVTEQAPGLIAVAEVENAQDGTIRYPEPIRLAVTVGGVLGIGGARVTALAIPPGSTPENPIHFPVELFDDGLAEHGDFLADDGVYSALFSGYVSEADGGGNGTWVFDVTVDNADGRAYEVFPSEDGALAPEVNVIPPFTIRTETCVLVRDVPDTLPEGTLALSSVALFPVAVELTQLAVTPVLAFSLVGDMETVEVRRVVVESSWAGTDPLPEVGLFLDADENGAPDTPAFPLARTLFDEDGVATFDTGAVLAMITPGSSKRFVVALGAPDEEPAAGALPPAVRAPRVPPWDPRGGLVLALLAAACAVLHGRRRVRVPAVACLLVLALVVGGSLGCGSPEDPDDTDDPPPSSLDLQNVPLVLTLDPAQIRARGATTRTDFPARGTLVSATVNILVEPP